METVGTGQQLYETMTSRYGQLSTQQRQEQPGKDTLYEPVAFPAPFPDFVDGHVAT